MTQRERTLWFVAEVLLGLVVAFALADGSEVSFIRCLVIWIFVRVVLMVHFKP